MVTQIFVFTSQRYKVLWGLAKSDKILLPREVSFDSPPNMYTLPEHWSWGHPKGWWNPQAGLLQKRKTRPLISCALKITQRHERREYVSGLGVKRHFFFPNGVLNFLIYSWRHSCLSMHFSFQLDNVINIIKNEDSSTKVNRSWT